MAASSSSVQDNNIRGMTVSSISLVTFTIGANLVFLRMHVRIKRHIIGWDDYTICVALVTCSSNLPPQESSITVLTRPRHYLFWARSSTCIKLRMVPAGTSIP